MTLQVSDSTVAWLPSFPGSQGLTERKCHLLERVCSADRFAMNACSCNIAMHPPLIFRHDRTTLWEVHDQQVRAGSNDSIVLALRAYLEWWTQASNTN